MVEQRQVCRASVLVVNHLVEQILDGVVRALAAIVDMCSAFGDFGALDRYSVVGSLAHAAEVRRTGRGRGTPTRPTEGPAMTSYLTADQLRAALELRDLTDPDAGPHAMQLLTDDVEQAIARPPDSEVRRVRHSPLVAVAANYDALGYGPADVTRNTRYSRYVSPTVMLRSHTSAMLPPTLAGH